MTEAPDFVADSATDGIPAPYGRACSSCARSKCRCVWQPQSTACDRCSRLKKKCTPGVPLRRRPDRHRSAEAPTPTSAARTTALEQKLNDLVSILQAKNGIGGGDLDGLLNQGRDSSTHHDAAAVLSSLGGSGTGSGSSRSPNDQSSSAPGPMGTSPESLCSSGPTPMPHSNMAFGTPPVDPRYRDPFATDLVSLIDPLQMEECFQRFRTCMIQYFPFVYIPPGTTAQGFRRHRPFLFLVIMANTYRHSPLQTALSERGRCLVAQKVAREGDVSLDYLLGILCFLGWKQFGRKDKISVDRSVITTFTQLAIGLIYDLCLHKQRTQRVSLLMVFRPAVDQQRELLEEPPAPTNEERRAVLATFLLTSQMSVTFKRHDALRWTQQMDDCLRVLSEHPECREDVILVTQVRLQLIVEQANQADWQIGQVMSNSMPGLQSAEWPPARGLSPVLVASLRSMINQVTADAPLDVRNHPAIILQSTTADLFLAESTVDRPSTSTTLATELSRLSTLEHCVQCTRTFFDCLLSLPAPSMVCISFPLVCNFTHNLLSLYTLSTRQEAGWNRSAVRDTIDVIAVLDRLIDLMPELGTALMCGTPSNVESEGWQKEDTFQQSIRVFKQFREMWSAEFSVMQASDQGQAPTQGAGVGGWFEGMDFAMNEEWLRDVFAIT